MSPGGRLPRGFVELHDEDAVDRLVAHILDPGRSQPVVVLTSRQRQRVPAFDPAEVRDIVGAEQEVHFVADGPLTRRLMHGLPDRLHVFGGAARVWWPGVGETSDPRDHPLVYERHGVYGSQAHDTLRRLWREGPPSDPRQEGDAERILLRQEVEGLREQLAARARDLHELGERLEEQRARAQAAEARARAARPRDLDPAPEAGHDLDAEGRFAVAVVRAWAASLDAASRRESPLRPFVLGPGLIASLEALEQVSEDRAAWVCAMVAAGRAPRIPGLQLHPLRASEGGGTPQRVREDGAQAWRCALRVNTPSAPRLHFWERRDGVVELARAVAHDDFGI